MNTLFALLIFAHAMVFTLAESSERHKQFAKECKTELNVNDEDFAILRSYEIPKNDAQSCLIDCLYTKLGVMVDGKLNEEGHKSSSKVVVGDDKDKLARMDEVFQKCSKEAVVSPDQKCIGKAMRTCVTTHFPDVVNWFKSGKKPT